MRHLQEKDWEYLIQRAETDPDLDNVRKYVEDVETAIVLQGMERFTSKNGHFDETELRRIGDRLLRIKRDRLKWPDPFDRELAAD
jgi:hypothetical protein